MISKSAGGIGLSVHNIRTKGSYIKGTNGTSNDLVPMLRVFNDTARRRSGRWGGEKGSVAIYLEPWHPDIFEFLDLRKNHGKEESRARDLFYALWTPGLFIRDIGMMANGPLFCPNECPASMTFTARPSWSSTIATNPRGACTTDGPKPQTQDGVVTSQIETGTPYMLYKDNVCECQVQPAESWAPSDHPTSALRSSNTPPRMRWRSATSPASLREVRRHGHGELRPSATVRGRLPRHGQPQRGHRSQLLPCRGGKELEHAPPPCRVGRPRSR